eukprot:TRINITY_DN13914_c0_g1_i1.p1 TRINITY_DN13914_c0_g1~~TRINITY_DN13914_c0_g1_i1.p1  ORF type:complete len:268 (+),score=56.80 TRINITY_DN13914_c0_g1_i1:255-1058(+)
MSRRYDTHTTTFSPEGHLYQVEYAIEAINHAGAAIGILTKEGVIIAAEKKVHSKLLEREVPLLDAVTGEKFSKVDDHIAVGIAGLTSDASVLVDALRVHAARYRFNFNSPIPVEQLVQQICDVKQAYTQHGGQRPFGVAFLFAGYDAYHGFQLYHSDPSGNYAAWRANAIGSNSTAALSLLKQEWSETLTLAEGLRLGVRVMAKTVDATVLSAAKVEFAVVSKDGFRILPDPELTGLIDAVENERLAAEAEAERTERQRKKTEGSRE